ncbi:hypothetical protein BJ166DRAFT_375934 [Pestalotiopsis sp. NC0098]|nr:hypothetical protein BJ166DRAFT_375934 [Pestalotiopsis sp. NC0098]
MHTSESCLLPLTCLADTLVPGEYDTILSVDVVQRLGLISFKLSAAAVRAAIVPAIQPTGSSGWPGCEKLGFSHSAASFSWPQLDLPPGLAPYIGRPLAFGNTTLSSSGCCILRCRRVIIRSWTRIITGIAASLIMLSLHTDACCRQRYEWRCYLLSAYGSAIDLHPLGSIQLMDSSAY